MSKFYVEAFYEDGRQILGNGDGQCIIYAANSRSLRKTNDYKLLKYTEFRKEVAYFEIIDAYSRELIERIYNARKAVRTITITK